MGDKPKFFVIPNQFALDIDFMQDFLLAEIMYKQQEKIK